MFLPVAGLCMLFVTFHTFQLSAYAHIQGTRFAAKLAVGKNKHNAERDIMAALSRSHGVPCRQSATVMHTC